VGRPEISIIFFTLRRNSAQGGVQDIVVNESNPPSIFDSEALAAGARLRFEPRLLLGSPVVVENVLFRFDWRLPR
jgi:outer membrane biosynthesis protein TonB